MYDRSQAELRLIQSQSSQSPSLTARLAVGAQPLRSPALYQSPRPSVQRRFANRHDADTVALRRQRGERGSLWILINNYPNDPDARPAVWFSIDLGNHSAQLVTDGIPA